MDSPNQGLIESYLLSDTVLHSSSHLQESVCVCMTEGEESEGH